MTSTPSPSIIDTRRDQMFPTLEALEVERVWRFGKMRAFAPTEPLAQIGKISAGLSIILSGEVDITRQRSSGQSAPIVTYGPGAFLGELAQLAGRPALVNATARGPVEALIIPPDQLRSLLVAEAELGERIMRALILRRIGLMETGAGGPVIVGRADSGDVLRLQGFLRSNAHPHVRLDPEADPEAKALIERFHVDPGQLPIVLCPSGLLLRNPSERRRRPVMDACPLECVKILHSGSAIASAARDNDRSRGDLFAIRQSQCEVAGRICPRT